MSSIENAMAALDQALVEELEAKSMEGLDLEDGYNWPDLPMNDKAAEVEEEENDENVDTFQVEMKKQVIECLYTDSISEKELLSRYPVVFSLPNKALVAEKAYPLSTTEFIDNEKINITRWRSINQFNIPNTNEYPNNPTLSVTNSFFEYNSLTGASGTWYPNFAHSCIFTAWNSYLLAQDELQVLEFPCLASLNQFLPRNGSLTVDRDGPSPILISNAIRRCSLDTLTSPSIYGNAFSKASENLILERLTILDPPIKSNIYAMEAPSSGRGEYKRMEILSILSTAYTAFHQIVQVEKERENRENINHLLNTSSENNNSSIPIIELHIGYWGCGAYGGNSILMVLIQLIAAKLANIEYVIVHGAPQVLYAHRAIEIFENEIPLNTTDEAVAWIVMHKFKWGVSDGN